MKKIGAIIVVAVFALIGVAAAVALTNTANNTDKTKNAINEAENLSSDTEVAEGNVTVNISDFEYSDKNLKIKAGTTITWVNQDLDRHDVTPDQNGSFDGSELLGKGDSYSHTFNSPGVFAYHCSLHPEMTAKVLVE